jgi:Holliday junction DNA helicase RuvA
MISYVRGELTEIFDTTIVVETAGGIGMNIGVPSSVLDRLPAPGSQVKVYTYLNVKEDAMELYGFLTRDDLNVFRLLITVNGVGPKGALGILSVLSPDDLRFAVMADDVKAIQAAPGIGMKTAQKVILELKDKVRLEDAFEHKLATTQADAAVAGDDEARAARNDAIQALVALGYGRTEAAKAVNGVEDAQAYDSEQLLKAALKKMVM